MKGGVTSESPTEWFPGHRPVSYNKSKQVLFLLNLKVSPFLQNFSVLRLELRPNHGSRFGMSPGADGFPFSRGSCIRAGAGDVCEPLWGEVPQRGGQVPLPERAHQSAVPKGERPGPGPAPCHPLCMSLRPRRLRAQPYLDCVHFRHPSCVSGIPELLALLVQRFL